MKVLSITTIYPNEVSVNEGRSVAFLDRALHALGVTTYTFVLRQWAPRWLAKTRPRWRHLSVKNRVQKTKGSLVAFDKYLHLPGRIRPDISARNMARRAGRLINRTGISFDIVHGQSIGQASLAAMMVAKKFSTPFVITLRDAVHFLRQDIDTHGPGLAGLYKEVFETVGAVFAHGPGIVNEIKEFVPPGRDIPVLLAANGIDPAEIEQHLEGMAPATHNNVQKVITVAYLYRAKGLHETLRALGSLKDKGVLNWSYTVVGDGPFEEELKALAMELGIGDKVVFKGRLPFSAAMQAIKESDVFCMPSWIEPFGNVFAEAAVCAKPVIGCKGTGAEVTVVDRETGFLVPPKDAPGLAHALERLINNPKEARAMGQRGRENIKRFTWQRTARLYKETMEKVLSGPKEKTSNFVQ